MKFAVLDGKRVEPTPKSQANCPACKQVVISKCGQKRIWHWAHKGRRHCDHWWENETEWHRAWKNQFPADWQEIVQYDEEGERHIADVKTPDGFVVEFQHSYIRPDEARKRTDFYKKMIWVVDATRRETDAKQFESAFEDGWIHRTSTGTVFQVWHNDARLLKEWVCLGVIIAFDFGKDDVLLLRRVRNSCVYLFEYPKIELVKTVSENKNFPDIQFGEPRARPRTRLRSMPPNMPRKMPREQRRRRFRF